VLTSEDGGERAWMTRKKEKERQKDPPLRKRGEAQKAWGTYRGVIGCMLGRKRNERRGWRKKYTKRRLGKRVRIDKTRGNCNRIRPENSGE